MAREVLWEGHGLGAGLASVEHRALSTFDAMYAIAAIKSQQAWSRPTEIEHCA